LEILKDASLCALAFEGLLKTLKTIVRYLIDLKKLVEKLFRKRQQRK
jgi:hypothetical protein